MKAPLTQLVDAAVDGSARARQTRAAARLMTLLESEPQRLPEVFAHLPLEAWPRPRLVLGITGAPGSGKSWLVDALIAEYRRRDPEMRIGVLAVDPSSPFTGGAILGDRVRMMRHAEDPNTFIRSLASRGHLGGLSLGARGVMRVMGLIGCELVIIETVGVGQSEVEVAGVADQVMVVLAPEQGDSIQMLKAGLMEIGDLYVINKMDLPGADRLRTALLGMLSFAGAPTMAEANHKSHQPDEERREVLMASANSGEGIAELVDELDERTAGQAETWQSHRDEAVIAEVRDAVLEDARRRLLASFTADEIAADELRRILVGELTVGNVSERLLEAALQTLRVPGTPDKTRVE